MSIKRNLGATYVSQILISGISIAAIPLYIKYMGLEAYGLVGLYLALQTWFSLMDLGLSPTMMRETARYRAGALEPSEYRGLLRSMEMIFVGLGSAIALMMLAASSWIARDWLKLQSLTVQDVTLAAALMAPSIGLRFVSALYRSTITGFEQLVWLSLANLGFALGRFVLVVPYMMFVSASPLGFFAFQLGISVIEAVTLALRSYRLGPGGQWQARPSWPALRAIIRFSAGIGFTGSAWVMITQADKLILSKILPLREYAVFTLAVLVAGGVSILSNPAGTALIPRLTGLHATGDEQGLILLYRRATQFVALMALSASVALALFAHQVVWAWTGQIALANEAALPLSLYAIGNGLFAVAAFPLYLQFARGDIKLHIIGQALLALVLIPTIVVAASSYGMVGAGWVWLSVNALYLLFYVPLIHRRFLPGLHPHWLVRDVAGAAAPGILVAVLCALLIHWPQRRVSVAGLLLLIAGAMVATSAAGSPWMRQAVAAMIESLATRVFTPRRTRV